MLKALAGHVAARQGRCQNSPKRPICHMYPEAPASNCRDCRGVVLLHAESAVCGEVDARHCTPRVKRPCRTRNRPLQEHTTTNHSETAYTKTQGNHRPTSETRDTVRPVTDAATARIPQLFKRRQGFPSSSKVQSPFQNCLPAAHLTPVVFSETWLPDLELGYLREAPRSCWVSLWDPSDLNLVHKEEPVLQNPSCGLQEKIL